MNLCISVIIRNYMSAAKFYRVSPIFGRVQVTADGHVKTAELATPCWTFGKNSAYQPRR